MKRILYFGYFIVTTDYSYLFDSFKEVKKKESISYAKILLDMIKCSFKYKASFSDYFLYEFYNKNHEQRDSYITTGRLYEFYTKMNDKKKRELFRDKAKFNKVFKKFIKRDFIFLNDCTVDTFYTWIKDKDCIIAKPNKGAAGKGIKKIKVKAYKAIDKLYSYLRNNDLDLIEECIEQHEEMNRMNPSSVNTIRIITVRNQGKTDVIGAVLRIGVDSPIDNFSAGGIAAPVDIESGIVYDYAVSKEGSLVYKYHPKTKCAIKGFQIPYWNDAIEMVMEASNIIPEVKTVGWDVAITKTGPELVEGNDNWNKNVFQLSHREGKQYLLDRYC